MRENENEVKMMQIAVYSDIHLEMSNFFPPKFKVDVVVLAGDIGKGSQGVEWAQKYFEVPIIYVFGNHEYYRGHYPKALIKAQKSSVDSSVFILECESKEIEGVRFLGCTLWTDFLISGRPYESLLEADCMMNDFRFIRTTDTYRKFRARDTLGQHQKSIAWLKDQLATPFAGSTVVVTHHAPHRECLNSDYDSLLLDGAYASDLSELIMAYQPELWIHGHTHKKVVLQIGATRIISNPRGYVSAGEETGFDPSFVVSL